VAYKFELANGDQGIAIWSSTTIPQWRGYINVNGHVNTGEWLGELNVTLEPWIFSYEFSSYIYMPSDEGESPDGAWFFIRN
jgi:hypothetical protein